MDKLFSKVFMRMFIGLAVTFGVAYYVASNPIMLENVFKGSSYIFIVIAELLVVIFLSARINKMSTMTAAISFLLYSALTGLTFSLIFVAYEISSIVFIFGLTSIIFLVFGLLGYVTNIDLTKMGTYLMMALFGIIIATVINMFVGSETFDLGLCIVGIIVFVGFIAYDIQKIKQRMYAINNEDNLAIYGALQLYLDFINIFIRLLQLFGKSRD